MNAPKLRFKEFNYEWVTKPLGNLVNYQKGFAFKSKDYCNKGIRIIRISDTTENSINNNNCIYVSKDYEQLYSNWKLKTDDIIISSVGSKPPLYDSMVGKVIKVPSFANDSLLNQNAIRFRTINDNQLYLYNYLKQKRYFSYIESIMRGNANQRSITLEDLFKFEISLPCLKEQTKIANMLQLLDKKIELQSNKIEALKLYKIYVRDNIITNNEYHECKLKDILTKWNLKNKNNEYSYVESVSNKFGFISQSEQFEDRNVASSDKSNYYIIKKNVFAYNPSRLDVGSLALKKNDKASLVSPLYECFTTTQNTDYMLEWFNSKYFRKETFSKFEGGVRNTLNFSNLSTIKIKLPTIEKQKNISTILLTINKKIELEINQYEKLNKLKKGLMQNMFV